MSSIQRSTTFNHYAESHQFPQGPGDARPTAIQIVQDEGLEGESSDKVILITGGSSGIGIETVRALAHTGAHIVVGVRDIKKSRAVIDGILARDHAVTADQFELLEIDLNSLDSVRAAAKIFMAKHKKLNILINNAGLGGVVEGRTADDFESHIGVNHLSHFLLFMLLRPLLISSSTLGFSSRVINVSSAIHRFAAPDLSNLNWTSSDPEKKYNPAKAYGASKTANIWFTNEIERRYGISNTSAAVDTMASSDNRNAGGKSNENGRIHSLSLHPGAIEIGLQQHHSSEFLEIFTGIIAANPDLMKTYKSLEQGAATTVLAAVGREFEGKGGLYLDDCAVAPLWTERDKIYAPGYVEHAFDEEGEKELWTLSCELVGLTDK